MVPLVISTSFSYQWEVALLSYEPSSGRRAPYHGPRKGEIPKEGSSIAGESWYHGPIKSRSLHSLSYRVNCPLQATGYWKWFSSYGGCGLKRVYITYLEPLIHVSPSLNRQCISCHSSMLSYGCYTNWALPNAFHITDYQSALLCRDFKISHPSHRNNLYAD